MPERLPKYLLASLLLLTIAAVAYLAFVTPQGHTLLHHPHLLHEDARRFATNHPILTPLLILAAYTLMTLSAMPVWWIQVLAGASLGLLPALLWCELAATLAATLTFSASRYIAGDFFHRRVESRLAKLKTLDEKLSHNGLLVVMAARLVHVVPFGISFYMFGLLTITTADVALGTLLGYLPATLLFVRTGSAPHALLEPRFLLLMALLHVALLTPLVLRYLHPQPFRRIGIE